MEKYYMAAMGGADGLGNKSISLLVEYFGSAQAAWTADVADLVKAELTEETTKKSETISQQDKQLHTAWFVFGTEKELKEQMILDHGHVLQANFNKEYFTKIDYRIDKEIKFYSKSAKMMTAHPSSSYTLQRDANKQYVLRITDPDLFWSTSKYLVVVVK